jgi:hypothetical protein
MALKTGKVVRKVSSSGQLLLSKKYAGRKVNVEIIDESSLLISLKNRKAVKRKSKQG